VLDSFKRLGDLQTFSVSKSCSKFPCIAVSHVHPAHVIGPPIELFSAFEVSRRRRLYPSLGLAHWIVVILAYQTLRCAVPPQSEGSLHYECCLFLGSSTQYLSSRYPQGSWLCNT